MSYGHPSDTRICMEPNFWSSIAQLVITRNGDGKNKHITDISKLRIVQLQVKTLALVYRFQIAMHPQYASYLQFWSDVLAGCKFKSTEIMVMCNYFTVITKEGVRITVSQYLTRAVIDPQFQPYFLGLQLVLVVLTLQSLKPLCSIYAQIIYYQLCTCWNNSFILCSKIMRA